MNKKKPILSYLLIGLILFQAVSALGGGGGLILDPSGNSFGLPLTLLDHSPFTDFLIPGLILLLFLGIIPLICFIGLINKPSWKVLGFLNLYKDQHWSWTYSYFTGIMLILWIDIEVMIVRVVDILHLVYSLLGVIIIIITLLPSVRKYYLVVPEDSGQE